MWRRQSWLLLFALVLGWVPVVGAHDVRGTAVFLDVGERLIDAELQVPLEQLRLALNQPELLAPKPSAPAADQTEADGLKAYLGQHLYARGRDARPFNVDIQSVERQHLGDGDVLLARVRLRPPAGASARWFELGYNAVLDRVVTHNVYVFVRHDLKGAVLGDKPELVGLMHYQNKALVIDRTGGSFWLGWKSVFLLGVRHIAEGTDHLLFLLMLLLPATLVAQKGRWAGAGGGARSLRETVKIVTAFTIGHSLTLLLGTVRGAELPARPVEVLIALSILISAIHALRPIFPGRESRIAAGFGLIHGLAFASVLRGFGFDRWTLSVGVLGFNLGVEAMQLTVVILTMPWLVMLSSSASYRFVRIGGGVFGVVAAGGWTAQRAFSVETPITGAVEAVASCAPWILAALAVTAVALKAGGVRGAAAHVAGQVPV